MVRRQCTLTRNVEGDFSWSVTLDNPLVTGESIDLNVGSLIDDYLTNDSGLIKYTLSSGISRQRRGRL